MNFNEHILIFTHFLFRFIFFLISFVFASLSFYLMALRGHCLVLDVEAFERLLGPCMEIMKRNIGDYETQLIKIFGDKNNISDIR